MKIPLRDGSQFDLDPFIDGFRAKYPHVDMTRELALLHLWLGKNPHAWPMKPLRFAENWLKKVKVKAPVRLAGGLTNQEIEEMGRKKGMPARLGESYPQWLRRMRAA